MINEGYIARIYNKDYKGTTLYSFTLKGKDGFFRTGEAPLRHKEGSYIRFNHNNKNTVDLGSIEVIKTVEATKGPAAYSSPAPMSKDDYWNKRSEKDEAVQKVIQYQSARNSAISVLDIATKLEAIKLPTKAADRLESLIEIVEELTLNFYKKASSFGQETDDNPQDDKKADEDVVYYDDGGDEGDY